jgi:hypothetical protein
MTLLPHRMLALASPGRHPTASIPSSIAAEREDELRAPDAHSMLRELKPPDLLEPDVTEIV